MGVVGASDLPRNAHSNHVEYMLALVLCTISMECSLLTSDAPAWILSMIMISLDFGFEWLVDDVRTRWILGFSQAGEGRQTPTPSDAEGHRGYPGWSLVCGMY